jgi:hypothetical protein
MKLIIFLKILNLSYFYAIFIIFMLKLQSKLIKLNFNYRFITSNFQNSQYKAE